MASSSSQTIEDAPEKDGNSELGARIKQRPSAVAEVEDLGVNIEDIELERRNKCSFHQPIQSAKEDISRIINNKVSTLLSDEACVKNEENKATFAQKFRTHGSVAH